MKLLLKESSDYIECTPKILESIFSIKYLSELQYSNWKVESYLRKKCATAYRKGKIKKIALWLGTLHAKEMTSESLPNITICWINDKKGYGVIANEPFKQWSFIGQYSGIVRRRNLLKLDLNDYCFMYPRQWVNFRPMTIDGELFGNYTRFINHSDYPNLESLAVFYNGMMHIIFRAIRDINAGEELSYDYGNLYWKRRVKVIEHSSHTCQSAQL